MELPDGVQIGRAEPVTITAANVDDVIWEQLADLIEHEATCPTPLDCRDCQRLTDARKILMGPFTDPELVAKAGA